MSDQTGVNDCIVVHDVCKTYNGEVDALKGTSMTVPSGAIIAILGPNGAGKTTLIKLMTGQLKPTAGGLRVLGLEPALHRQKLMSKVGILPQGFKTFDHLTVNETLDYYKTMYGVHRDLSPLLVEVGLEEHASKLVKNLSGGLNQKLGVVLALVPDPEIAFLDEPSTGLDPSARRDLWKTIRKLKDKDITVVLTTHYLDEAEELADYVYILVEGIVEAEGTVAELITKHGGGMGNVRLRVASREVRDQLAHELMEWSAKIDGDHLIIPLGSKVTLSSIFKVLESHDVMVEDVLIQRPDLEDVFLNLTGFKLQEGVAVVNGVTAEGGTNDEV